MISLSRPQKLKILYGTVFILLAVAATALSIFYYRTYYGDATEIHLSFIREVNGSEHVFFDGKDLGEKISYLDVNPIMTFYSLFPSCSSSNNCAQPVLSGKNIVFMRIIGDKPHIIYNGVDQGEGFFPILSPGHLAFYRMVSNKIHIIYDGNDLGEGEDMVLEGNHLGYSKREVISRPFENPKETRAVIYDGEYVGRDGINLALSGDNYAFMTLRGGCFKAKSPPDNSQCVPYDDLNSYVIFNGENMGIGTDDVTLKDGHIIFRRFSNLIYDGKDLGVVWPAPLVSGNNTVFTKKEGEKEYLIFNGKDLGEGTNPVLDGNNLAYEKKINNKRHIMFNGKDLGEGLPRTVTLSDGHIAFLRDEIYTPFELYKKVYEECSKIDGETKCGKKMNKQEFQKEFDKLSEQEKKDEETFTAKLFASKILVYDGKEIQDEVEGIISDFSLLGAHFVYTKKETYRDEKGVMTDKTTILLDGKNLGEGYNPALSKD